MCIRDRDYRGGTAGAVFDERILFPDDHKKCEVERRTVVEGASADQIQIIKVQIINYRDRNKSVPFYKNATARVVS